MNKKKRHIIISTRPYDEQDELRKYFAARDVEYIDLPMIEVKPRMPDETSRNLLNTIASFQWIIFTSKNGVKYFFHQLKSLGLSTVLSQDIKTAVIGKRTAKELRFFHGEPSCISSGNTSDDFLDVLKKILVPGERVLVVLGNIAPSTLEKGLSPENPVCRVDVYETTPVKSGESAILKKIEKGDYDLLVFTSPSAVNSLLSMVNIRNLKAVCIGERTSSELSRYEISPLLVSQNSSIRSLAEEMEFFLNK